MIFKPRPACGDDTGPLFDFGSLSTAYRRRRKDPAVVQKNTFLNARLQDRRMTRLALSLFAGRGAMERQEFAPAVDGN